MEKLDYHFRTEGQYFKHDWWNWQAERQKQVVDLEENMGKVLCGIYQP